MKTLTLNPKPHVSHVPNALPLRLERIFVETGDERCPIAGIWLKLAASDQTPDEPALVRPAMAIPLWRAFHHWPTSFCYSAA